jgi:tRNA G18 (ribose-2'-O)-methylase SpoU
MIFTEKKFSSLPLPRQHKKCAEVLRSIYEKLLKEENDKELCAHYLQMRQWLSLLDPFSFSLEEISDQYHEHLQMSGYFIKEHNLLPTLTSLDRKEGEAFLPICIYLDHVRSAYNVGSILRTTEAMRLGSVYFSEKTPFIDNEKTQKTSMGTFSVVPCFANAKIETLPRPLIGLDTSKEALSLNDFLFPETFTLILGNEEYGISPSILQQLDYLVEIPLQGCKNSINVACAYAIAAAAIRRQKTPPSCP